MLNYVVPLALVVVSIVLMLGLWNMMRGGSASRSQMLMRWRVGLQFAAIVLLVLAVWWTKAMTP
jgi:chromate transport protein ChrA